MKMIPIKNKARKANLTSKRKIVVAIKLFEKFIDEDLVSISVYGGNYYHIQGNKYQYSVDISNNTVKRSCPDHD